MSYNYYFDVEEADKLLLVEEWVSEDKQQNHLKTAHMNAFKQIKEKYVLSTSVQSKKQYLNFTNRNRRQENEFTNKKESKDSNGKTVSETVFI